ncbi:MAG: AmmeMemoRadiSam system radical SAM enzyme [Candidatus Hydrogenedentota bacterium]
MQRREFLKCGIAGTLFSVCSNPVFAITKDDERFIKEAMFYEKREKNSEVRCKLCPRECGIINGGRGFCEVRENINGKLYTLVHSRCVSANIDPIEKKPFFHYLPGTKAFSIATAGCNFECKFCQNWQISQFRPEDVSSIYAPPWALVNQCITKKVPTISYTYSEPIIFYEYMYDTSKLAREKGIGNVMVSNGFINAEPLKKLCEVLTGIKIDFKSFNNEFYREICSSYVYPVLETMKLIKKLKMWLEIVVLILPTKNDKQDEIKEMSKWILDNLGPDVPVHFSRFHPTYKITNLPPTPVETIERCCEIAKLAGIHYVYMGNVAGHKYESTYCHKCGKVLIKRYGYYVLENNLKGGFCPYCNQKIPGVFL